MQRVKVEAGVLKEFILDDEWWGWDGHHTAKFFHEGVEVDYLEIYEDASIEIEDGSVFCATKSNGEGASFLASFEDWRESRENIKILVSVPRGKDVALKMFLLRIGGKIL